MLFRKQFLFGLVMICLTGIAILHPGLRAEALGSGLPSDISQQSSTYLSATITTRSLDVGQIRFERISVAEGLSLFNVRAILQDSQGFMWIGTFGGGLNKYDGYEFTVYEHDPGESDSLSHGVVQAIYEDRSGVLWVGTIAGLDKFDRATGAFTHFLDDKGPIFSIFEDSKGRFWVGVGDGLVLFDRASGTVMHTFYHAPNTPDDPGMLSGYGVFEIYEDREGELWIGTGGGLDQLILDESQGGNQINATFAHYRHDPDEPGSLSGSMIQTIFEDDQGSLWIGTWTGGLNRLDRFSDKFTHYQHDPDDPGSLSDNRVISVLEDDTGSLWVGTFNGLDRLDRARNRFVHYRHDPVDPQSLGDDVITTLYEDRSGVLWVGTNGNGVSKYSRAGNRFPQYQLDPDHSQAGVYPVDAYSPFVLSDSKVSAIHEDREGVLWIGTFNGGLDKLDRQSGRLIVYRHDPADPSSLSSDQVFAVYQDHAGVLWVGAGSWLERFDSFTETFIHSHNLGTQVEKIVEDSLGNLWIGTPSGLFRLEQDRDTLTHYYHVDDEPGSLSFDDIQAVYVDRSGGLWVGTFTGGINLWDSDSERFIHYRHDPDDPNSLGRDGVLAFYEDPGVGEGTVWVGTWGGGLARFDRATQTFTHFTTEDGLPDDSVGCILPDADGFLWLGTVKGVSRFDLHTETFRNYDEQDGLLSGGFGPGICFRTMTGELLFGRSDGIDAFYPDQITDNSHAPPVVITTFNLFNQTVRRDLPADDHIWLSYRENFISFEFAALDFTVPEKNRYAYMMEGLDPDWVYAGTRRHADYPNLRPGDYVFRVKGSNNDGVWNEDGAAVHISIKPPFWETLWFRGIIVLALVGAAFAGYRLRVRGIETRSRELENLVEERTREVERLYEQTQELAVVQERNRLARDLHDAVTQTLFSASLIADVLPKVMPVNQEKGLEQLEEVRQLTRGALAEMRTMLLELRPDALSKAKMGDLLGQLGRAMTGRTGIPVDIDVEDQDALPPTVQVALYRIAQEALNNAGKHAEASEVKVRYSGEPGRATLLIQDDGRGFNLDKIPAGHFGVGNMRERAKVIGAALRITTQPGMGTNITVDWYERTEDGNYSA